jgi:AcrR family transcriptional regulator
LKAPIRKNDPAGTRRKIVGVAFAAFVGDGYGVSATRDLRKASGVSSGAFAHHFPTKKALGLAVIREHVAAAVEETWIAPLLSAPDTISGLRAVFEGTIADLTRSGVVTGCPVNNLAIELSGQDDDLREEIAVIFQRWRATIAGKLAGDVRAGRLSKIDPESMATLVVASFSGAMAMAKALQSVEPIRECWRELQRLIRKAAVSKH